MATSLSVAAGEEDYGLPAWAYTDPDMLAAEAQRIFRRSWQIICHVSDIPAPGDWH